MTNPLNRAVESLQHEIETSNDPRTIRSLQLALGSARAAQSKFYPARAAHLRVMVDSAGLPVSSTSTAKLTQAISDTTAMLGAYRTSAEANMLPTQMHASYRSRFSLISLGAVGNMIEFGFREFGAGDEPSLVVPFHDIGDTVTRHRRGPVVRWGAWEVGRRDGRAGVPGLQSVGGGKTGFARQAP